MKVRRKKSGSAVEFYINNEQTVLYNIKGGIGALYELCAPSWFLTSNFSLSPEVNKSLYQELGIRGAK